MTETHIPVSLHACLAAPPASVDHAALVRALLALPAGTLPLQRACQQGGLVDETGLTLSVLTVVEADDGPRIRLGALFSEIVGGCNCHDDPLQANAYGLLEIRIRRADGLALARLLAE